MAPPAGCCHPARTPPASAASPRQPGAATGQSPQARPPGAGSGRSAVAAAPGGGRSPARSTQGGRPSGPGCAPTRAPPRTDPALRPTPARRTAARPAGSGACGRPSTAPGPQCRRVEPVRSTVLASPWGSASLGGEWARLVSDPADTLRRFTQGTLHHRSSVSPLQPEKQYVMNSPQAHRAPRAPAV